MSFKILQRAYAPYGTAAQFPASGDSRLIYRATDTGYLYTWDASERAYKLAGIAPATVQSDISTLQGNVATLTQGIQDSVSTHNTAPDSHADLRTLIGDRALSVHQHARADLPWVTEPGAALLTAASASAQRTALGMTAWAVAPWTDGTTSDIPEGTQLYFTNARADARADARIAAQKGQAEGIMPLGSSGKAPLAYMPDALIGQVKFNGVWDAATNSPVLPSATTSMGHYYVTSVAGSYGGIDYGVGDWCISDGTAWGKVDNSDAITSFAGRVGAILPIASDYSSFYLGLHAQADDAAKLGAQLPAYYLARGNHTGTQPASSISDFAATTRSTVATGMVTTTPEVALATDTLLVIIGKLQAQINSDRRYDYAAQIGGGENLLVPIGTTGGGTGISVFNLYSEIENTATLTSGEFYSDSTGTTSLGRSVPLAAGAYTSLFIKLTSGTDTLVVTHGWAVTSFGNASAGLEEVTNGPRALGFDLKYMPRRVGIAYFYCIYGVISGQTAPWINATFLYFLGKSLSISGQTYPWSLATVVFFNGSEITISGQAYAWVNARRVIISGNLIAVSVNLSASCMYIGSAGLDIFIDGSGILVSYPTSRAWPAVLGRIYLRPASGTMPSADVDRLCNDLATYTTSATGDKVLDLRGRCGVATSASATARTYLAGLGIAVSVNT